MLDILQFGLGHRRMGSVLEDVVVEVALVVDLVDQLVHA